MTSFSKSILPSYDKKDVEKCMNSFRTNILSNVYNLQNLKMNLINLGKMNNPENEFLRAFLWKVYLGVIPINENSTFQNLLQDTIANRNQAKTLIKGNAINKLKGDPLGASNTNSTNDKKGWDNFFNQNESSRLIRY